MILYSPPVRHFHIVPQWEIMYLIDPSEQFRMVQKMGAFMARQRIGPVFMVYHDTMLRPVPALWKQMDRDKMITIFAISRIDMDAFKINMVYVFPRPFYNYIDASETATDHYHKYHLPGVMVASN
jgi:hypothetical protein